MALGALAALFGGVASTAPKAYFEGRQRELDYDTAKGQALDKAAFGNALALMQQGGGGMTGGLGMSPAPMGGAGPGSPPQGPAGGPPPPSPGASSPPMQQNPNLRLPMQGPMQPQFPGAGAGGPMPPPSGASPMPEGAPPWAVQGLPGPPQVPPMAQQASLTQMAPGGAMPPRPMMPQGPGLQQPPRPPPGPGGPGGAPPGGMAGPPGPPGGGNLSQPMAGQYSIPQLVGVIQRANPGIQGERLFGAVVEGMKLLHPQDQLAVRERLLDMREREFMYRMGAQGYEKEQDRQSRENIAGLKKGSQPADRFPQGQQPSFRRSSDQEGGPDLSGGPEKIEKASLTLSPEWAQGQPPEIAQSPAVTGVLPKGHIFAQGSPKDYKLTPDDMNTALAIYQYRRAPMSGAFAQRDPRQVAIMNAVERLGPQTGQPSYDAGDWDAHKRGSVAFGTGTQANTIRSIGVAQAHLQTLGELAQELEDVKGGESSLKALANFNNIMRTQLGGAEANNIDAARQIIAAEVIKAINASGGGVKERLEAAAHIDPALNVKQMRGVIDTYQRLLDGQIKGFEGQWSRVPGNKDKDFYKQFNITPKGKTEAPKAAPAAAPAASTGEWKIEPVQ